MKWNDHSSLQGQHAFLSASNYHWINYDNEKLIQYFNNYRDAEKGTMLHAFAAECITLGQKLPKSQKTLNNYVNDVPFRSFTNSLSRDRKTLQRIDSLLKLYFAVSR